MTTQKQGAYSVFASALVGVLIVALLAGGTMLLGGVSFFGASGSDEAQSGEIQGEAATRMVVDSVGREVWIPEQPEHLAALDSFSGNVCVLVGAGEQLYGAPGGVISSVLLQRIYPELKDISQLGGSSVNIEELLAAEVDVALVRRGLYEDEGEVAKLERMDIAYVVVDYTTVEEQIEAIELVGTVCGTKCDETTAALVAYYRDTVELVEEKAAKRAEAEQQLVYHSINDPLLTDGADSLGADWITRTGAVDVSSDTASTGTLGDYTATLEQIYVWEPNVIICNTAEAAQEFSTNERWGGLEAVSSGKVYTIPVSAGRWGQRGDPETFLAMLWLGKTIYPDLYRDIDLQETVSSYYKDIIGLEIDDETYQEIISGEGLRAQGAGTGGEQ